MPKIARAGFDVLPLRAFVDGSERQMSKRELRRLIAAARRNRATTTEASKRRALTEYIHDLRYTEAVRKANGR